MRANILLGIFNSRYLSSPECKYTLFIFLSQVGMFFYSNDMYLIGESLRVIGAFGFIFTLFKSFPLHAHNYPLSLKLLTIMIFVQTLRILDVNPPHTLISSSMKETFAGVFLSVYVLPSLMPLILYSLFGTKINLYYFSRISIILGFIYVIIYPFAFFHMINYQWSGDASIYDPDSKDSYSAFVLNSNYGISNLIPPFVLLFWKYFIKRKHWYIILIALIGGLLNVIYLGRRGGVVIYLLLFTISWAYYFYYGRYKIKNITLFILIIIVSLIFFYNNFQFFETIISRGFENTRSGVEDSLYEDLEPIDWIIGRGWFGCYYDSMFKEYRMGIETGYLTLLLRGGVFYLLLYLWVLAISVYKGLAKSNNTLVKTCAIYIAIQILILYPGGIPNLSLNYLFIWIGVYLCLSERIREMSNQDITRICFSK